MTTTCPPGPELQWGFLCPTVPSAGVWVCGSCHRREFYHGELRHAPDCPWVTWTRSNETTRRFEVDGDEA